MLRKTKQQIAHTSIIPSLGNRDLKSLQNVINTEKTFIKDNAEAGQAWRANGEALRAWGEGEGDELSDVLSKLSILFDHYAAAQDRLNSHLSTLRLHFKSVRTREEGLANAKAKKRALASKIESVEKKLSKMGPENKELPKTTASLKEYRGEMQALTTEVVTEELAIGDFKRRTAKEAMGLKCGGLLEFADKLAIVAEIGKMMIDEIPLDATSPGVTRPHYSGHTRTEQLLSEANRCISDVGFAPSGQLRGSSYLDRSQVDDSMAAPPGEDAYHDSGAYQRDAADDPEASYTGGGRSYNATADRSDTPIYASLQTTQPWKQEQDNKSFQSAQQDVPTTAADLHVSNAVHTEDLRDQTADDWARSTEAGRGTPNHTEGRGQENSFNPIGRLWTYPNEGDNHDPTGGVGQANLNGEASRPFPPNFSAAHEQPATSQHAPAVTDLSGGAPSLPPLRVASPIASGPGTMIGDVDEDPYFAAVGSTRAAQAAARRPTSPITSNATAKNRYGGGSVSSFGAFNRGADQNISSPTSRYEPAESGRKTTAAAFRKGFNRTPSTSLNTNLPSTPSGEVSSLSLSRQDPPSAVEPLAIRKRHSAVEDTEVAEHDFVPPYVAGQPSTQSGGYNESAPVPSGREYEQAHAHPNGYLDPNYHDLSRYDDSQRADYAPQHERYQSVYGGVDDEDTFNQGGASGNGHQQSPPPLPQHQPHRGHDVYSDLQYPTY